MFWLCSFPPPSPFRSSLPPYAPNFKFFLNKTKTQ